MIDDAFVDMATVLTFRVTHTNKFARFEATVVFRALPVKRVSKKQQHTMSFYACATPVQVKPTATAYVADILFPPNQECHEAWVLAKRGVNGDGPARIRLVDQYNQPLSDYVDTFSSSMERLKLTGVNIAAELFPPVVRIEVVNKSTTDGISASVAGVMFVY